MDISLLRVFGTTAQKEYDAIPTLAEIDPITGTIVDTQFANTITEGTAITEVSQAQTIQPDANTGSSFYIFQATEPFGKRRTLFSR